MIFVMFEWRLVEINFFIIFHLQKNSSQPTYLKHIEQHFSFF
jgi:hypothetical protein